MLQYIVVSKSHCEKAEMGLDDPKLLSVYMSFVGQEYAICVLFFKVEHVPLLYNCVKWLLLFRLHLYIHAGVAISGPVLSLTTDIMYISVFPGFWKLIPMTCIQELLMTASVAYVNSLSM